MINFNKTENDCIARYWDFDHDGRISCNLCPRFCKLNEGQRGLCFVRMRKGDKMILDTYGRSSGFCIDPIEKKPLNHFLPGTAILSFGTAGCNLSCKFCQNHEISKSRQVDSLTSMASPQDLALGAKKSNCASIAYTYNDPVIFLEYAVDVAQAAREQNVKNVAVTAGYICKSPREEFFKHMDAVNIDIKAFTERFYKKLTASSLAPVLETIEYVAKDTNCWLELTCLLISGENDSEGEIYAMSEWIAQHAGRHIPLHFTAFHPDYKMMDVPRTPTTTLLKARKIALECGLKHVYIGNARDDVAQSTYCEGCDARLIGRDWHNLTHWALDHHGGCVYCGTKLAGVFDGPAGKWDGSRKRLKFGERR